MKHAFLALSAALAMSVTALSGCGGGDVQAQAIPFVLTSADLTSGTFDNKFILNGFGCTGGNLSPALVWRNVPAGTKSLSLQVHDPDAPTGVGGFTHWIVYNIPVTASKFEKNAGTGDGKLLPSGSVQHVTSFGAPGWGGPCPPAGRKPHRYVFTLYALGVDKLELPANASQAFVGLNINVNALAPASFTVFYDGR